MAMNKREFIEKLSNEISYSIEDCTIINNILENNFFISKKNKDKTIIEIMNRLDVDKMEATNIYDKAVSIINEEIKFRFKHPFKNKE